jgi:hypothetical protein
MKSITKLTFALFLTSTAVFAAMPASELSADTAAGAAAPKTTTVLASTPAGAVSEVTAVRVTSWLTCCAGAMHVIDNASDAVIPAVGALAPETKPIGDAIQSSIDAAVVAVDAAAANAAVVAARGGSQTWWQWLTCAANTVNTTAHAATAAAIKIDPSTAAKAGDAMRYIGVVTSTADAMAARAGKAPGAAVAAAVTAGTSVRT